MSFISPSMEAEMAANAKAAAEKKQAADNAAAADTANNAQKKSSNVPPTELSDTIKFTDSASEIATGRAKENINKVKKGLEAIAQLSVLKKDPAINGAADVAGSILGIVTGKAKENMTKVQQALQVIKMGKELKDSLDKATATIVPVKVTAEVNINGKIISPILSAEITQKIGEHNKLVLRFHHDLLQKHGDMLLEQETQSLLGQVVELILMNKNNPDGRNLKGKFIIASIDMEEEAMAEGIIALTCYSATMVLEGAPHYQSFYKKSLKEIAEDICTPMSNVKGEVKADPFFTIPINYVCCFDESHWDFLKRLAAETGQWLYYTEEGLIFGKPTKGESFKLVYGQNCYKIAMGVKVAAVQSGIFDYDATNNKPMDEATNENTEGVGSYAKRAFEKSNSLFTAVAQAGPSTMAADKGLLETMSKARSAGVAASLYTIKGSSTEYGLHVGALASLEFKRQGQSASHSPIRIISIQHHYSAAGKYENEFEAILSSASFPPPIAFTNPQTHPLLAQVIDNKDPQNQGRVRVKFLGWKQKDEQTTDWIRALTPDAGGGGEHVAKNRGLVTIPEVGDQVMIDFELNNPDRPFITGSVFHGHHGSGGGGGNNVKSLTSKSGHTVRLDDGGAMSMVDKSKLQHITLDGENAITIGAGQKITLKVGTDGGSIVIDGKNITIKGLAIKIDATEAGGNIDAQSQGNTILKSTAAGVTVEAAQVLTAKGKMSASLNGDVVEVNATKGDTTVKGKNVRINC
ncbi:MAG: phage baseplate assembly protein V [Chitinophagaceae bacterium]